MTPDGELLSRYVERGSEEAFGELVRRHIDLVYSTALRQLNGDAHLAQDIAQLVFTDLARKARKLSSRPVLSGWLYTSAYFAAANAVRTERRRHVREQEAYLMRELHESAQDIDWDELRPVLDAAMHQLRESDREAILLRYFENHTFTDVGAKLGIGENAARMRVDRAVEKLRPHLTRRGVTGAAGVIATVLSTHAVQAAPPGLAATLASSSLASAAAGGSTIPGILKIMSMTKFQIGLTALVLVGAATLLLKEQASQAELRRENDSLRSRIDRLQTENENLSQRFARFRAASPRLPAPALQLTANTSTIEELGPTNLYDRLAQNTNLLTLTQLEPYLTGNRRNAASLLAAYRTSGDVRLLEEAKQKLPNDPQVAFEAAFKEDVAPEERRQWLDTFKKSAPDNALANYLSALDYFRAGHSDQAVQELTAASGKAFEDYTSERYQDDAEAYIGAGYSIADAKVTSGYMLLLPQLKQVKELGLDIVELSKSYRQSGDTASADAAVQMTINLGQRYSSQTPGEPLVSQLVGIALERIALGTLDPNSAYGNGGQTVQDRMDQLVRQKTQLADLGMQPEALYSKMSDQDWINYRDRWMLFGENNAVRWVLNKYGQK